MDAGGRAGAVLTTIHTVGETGSTNADLLVAGRDGAGEGSWLSAERQTAGRGRLGRAWVSPAGNLYASTLVRARPTDPPAATLALVAGLALDEAVSAHLAASLPIARALRLKWPNDVLLNGAKLCGILLERAGDAIVVGFGANLAHHPDLPERRTTSLAEHGVDITPALLLDTLVEAFSRWLAHWRGGGVAPVRRRWLERAHPPGTALTARLPDGTAVDGLFDGLDGDGALILRLGGGERRVIHAGDIFLL